MSLVPVHGTAWTLPTCSLARQEALGARDIVGAGAPHGGAQSERERLERRLDAVVVVVTCNST